MTIVENNSVSAKLQDLKNTHKCLGFNQLAGTPGTEMVIKYHISDPSSNNHSPITTLRLIHAVHCSIYPLQ